MGSGTSPGCQIDGNARNECLNEEIELESGEIGTLRDVIAPYGYQGPEPDPAEEAARNLDWETFLAAHPPRHPSILFLVIFNRHLNADSQIPQAP